MLGHAEEWFYAGLGGIHIDSSLNDPERIAIHPAILDRVASADVLYRSVWGPVHVAWKHSAAATTLDVTVPVNTTATVTIPAAEEGDVRESGRPASDSLGVALVKMENGFAVLRVESGTYHFSIPARAHR